MWELSDRFDTQPDIISYSSVIDCWAKSDGKVAASRAETILREMKKKFDSGHDDLLPSALCYTSVINALARRGEASRAESLLQEMYNDYQYGNQSAKPDLMSCNAVLNALGKSGSPDAPERAEAILAKMWELSDLLDTQPDVTSYNSVLECWAKSNRNDSASRSEAVLLHMKKQKIIPDRLTMDLIKQCGRNLRGL